MISPHIVVNQILADELSLVVGDDVELGYYISQDNSRKRVEQVFSVFEVVDNAGMANLAGTKCKALFTDLIAQELINTPSSNQYCSTMR